jgi:carboxyl-terminal processing protease
MAGIGREPALILDLRGNPGGLVDSVDEVAGMFLPPGTLISTGTRRYNLFGSQRFTATDNSGFTYPGRLVVLIDKNSRSGAESLARALQYYHRATLVGTRSAGKVLGVDAEMTLADGGLLRVATLDMHAPDGQRLEGQGVRPDLVVSDQIRQVRTALALLDDEWQVR